MSLLYRALTDDILLLILAVFGRAEEGRRVQLRLPKADRTGPIPVTRSCRETPLALHRPENGTREREWLREQASTSG